jgi:hypothetical protein
VRIVHRNSEHLADQLVSKSQSMVVRKFVSKFNVLVRLGHLAIADLGKSKELSSRGISGREYLPWSLSTWEYYMSMLIIWQQLDWHWIEKPALICNVPSGSWTFDSTREPGARNRNLESWRCMSRADFQCEIKDGTDWESGYFAMFSLTWDVENEYRRSGCYYLFSVGVTSDNN